MRFRQQNRQRKKHAWNHTVDRADLDVDWCHSTLAAQQGLGLRAKRWIGAGGHHHHRVGVDGQAVEEMAFPMSALGACAPPVLVHHEPGCSRDPVNSLPLA